MSETVSEVLRERFVRRFLAAWPERDVPEESIRSALALSIEDDPDGPMLVASLLGYTISFGVPTDQTIERVAVTSWPTT